MVTAWLSVQRLRGTRQVLGHQLITEGLGDLLMSWTYPNSALAVENGGKDDSP